MTESRNDVDEVLDELHQLRVALDERFGHDPEKYFAYIREYERQLLREGWVQAPPPPPEYVERVSQALERVRQNPHLLDFPGQSGPAEGGAAALWGRRRRKLKTLLKSFANPQDRASRTSPPPDAPRSRGQW